MIQLKSLTNTVNGVHQDIHEVCKFFGSSGYYVLVINLFIESTDSVSCNISFLFTFFHSICMATEGCKYGKRQEELKNIKGSKTEHSTITDWYKGLHDYFSMYTWSEIHFLDVHWGLRDLNILISVKRLAVTV